MIQPFDVAHVNLNVTTWIVRSASIRTSWASRSPFNMRTRLRGSTLDNIGTTSKGFGHGFHDVALYKVVMPAPDDRRRHAGMNHMA